MYSLNIENNAQVIAVTGTVSRYIDKKLLPLRIGDNVVMSDILVIDADSNITLQYSDGSIITYTPNDLSSFEPTTHSVNEPIVETNQSNITGDIAAIQQTITDGNGDLELPATASGGNGNQGGISFVSLERYGNESIVSSSFLSNALSNTTANSVENRLFNSNPQDTVIADFGVTIVHSIDHPNQSINLSGEVVNNGPNSLITLTITDINNATVIINNIAVDDFGNYIINGLDISTLSDGNLNIEVSVIDDNNQSSSITDSVLFDSTPPQPPLVTINDGNDGIINTEEKSQGISLTIDLSQPGIASGYTLNVIFGNGAGATETNIVITQEMLNSQSPALIIPVPIQHLINAIPLEVSMSMIDGFNNESQRSLLSRSIDTIAPGEGEQQSNPLVVIGEATNGISAEEAKDGITIDVTPPIGSNVGDIIEIILSSASPTQAQITIRQAIPTNWTEGSEVNITIPPAQRPDDGAYIVTVTVIDDAGNISEPSDNILININTNTIKPLVFIDEAQDGVNKQEAQDGIQIEIIVPTNSSPGDIITISILPVDGSTPANETVIIPEDWDGKSSILATISNNNLPNDGTHTVTVNIITPSSLPVGEPSDPFTFNLDTVAPGENSEPNAPLLEIPESQGGINAQEIKDGIQVHITLPSGSRVGDNITLTITSIDGSDPVIKTHQVPDAWDGLSTISITIPHTPALPDGQHNITATVTDASGNTSQSSPDFQVDIDTNSNKPTVYIEEAKDGINALEASDGFDISINPPTGTLPGHVINITLTPDSSGENVVFEQEIPVNWNGIDPIIITVLPENVPSDGEYEVVVQANDPFFGVVGEPSDPELIIIDTTAPGETGDPLVPVVSVPENIDNINAQEFKDGIQVFISMPSGTISGDIITLTITSPIDDSSVTVLGTVPLDWDGLEPIQITIETTQFSSDGDYNISATITDGVGNTSQPSNLVGITLDTTSDKPTVFIEDAEGGINKTEASDGIEISIIPPTGSSIGDIITVSVTPSGSSNSEFHTGTIPPNWNGFDAFIITISPDDIPDDGIHNIQANVATNDGTLIGNDSDVQAIFIDTLAPGEAGPIFVPVIDIPEATGGINSEESKDGIQVSVTPPSGTQAGDIIALTITQDSSSNPTTVFQIIPADWNGIEPIEVTIPASVLPTDGQHNISAVVNDKAGNSSLPSSPITVELNTESTKPTVYIEEAENGINRAEIADGIQIEINPPIGTQPGDIITVAITSASGSSPIIETYEIASDWDGNSRLIVTIPPSNSPTEGAHDVVVRVNNPVTGIVGEESEKEPIVIDTLAPGVNGPVIKPTLVIPEALSGINKNELEDGLQVHVTPPTGTQVDDNIGVSVFSIDGVFIGTYSTTVPLTWNESDPIIVSIPQGALTPDGDYSINATVQDKAGNFSAISDNASVSVDTKAPGEGAENNRPILLVPEAESGVNKEELANGIQTLVTPPVGSQVGDIIILTLSTFDGTPDIDIRVAIDISWDGLSPIGITISESNLSSDGQYELVAYIADSAGNLSENSETVILDVDKTSPGENSGRAAPINAIPEALNNINESELSDGIDIFISVPFGSIIGDLISINIQPSDGRDVRTFEFLITDQWSEGEDIQITIPKLSFLIDGDYEVTSHVSDKYGNTSLTSKITTITIDSTAPGDGIAPLLTIPESSNGIDKEEATDGIQTIVIAPAGTLPGDIIVFTITSKDTDTPITFTTSVPNNWASPEPIHISIPSTILPGDGVYDVSVKIIDESGNPSEPSHSLTIELDTSVPGEVLHPAPPVVDVVDAANDNGVNDDEFNHANGIDVSVTLPSNVMANDIITVTLTRPDGAAPQVIIYTVLDSDTPGSDITVTFNDNTNGTPETLIDGLYAVSAIATHAGVDSELSNTQAFTLDRTAPGEGDGTPGNIDEAALLNVPENDGGINENEASDGIQVNVTPPTGTQAGDTITLTVTLPNGTTQQIIAVVPTPWADEQVIEVTVPVAVISDGGKFVDGDYAITATVTDTQGNESKTSEVTNVTLATDTTGGNGAITPPIITIDAADDGFINSAENAGFNILITAPSNAVAGDIITLTLDAVDDTNDTIVNINIPADWDGTSPLINVMSNLVDGEKYAVNATINTNGSDSQPSNAINFIVDINAPGTGEGNGGSNLAPTLTIIEANDGVNADEASDGVTTQVTPPTSSVIGDTIQLTVTQPGGSEVVINHTIPADWVDGSVIEVVIPAANLSAAGAFNDGDYTVTATVTDTAGNMSKSSQANFTLNTAIILPPETISIAGPDSVIEGDETSNYTVMLSSNVPIGEVITVLLSYSGSATDGSDYTGVTSVDIIGGENSVTFKLSTLDDSILETGNETENIEISINGITGTNNTAGFTKIPVASETENSVTTLIISDIESLDAPVLSISGPSQIIEGTTDTFTISIDTPTVLAAFPGGPSMRVNITVTGNEPLLGEDISYDSFVIFYPNESSQSFELTALADNAIEGLEQINVSIQSVFVLANNAGFEAKPIISIDNGSMVVSIIDKPPLTILDVVDNTDNFSKTSLNGTGGNAGQTVQIIDDTGLLIGVTTVDSNGDWSFDFEGNTALTINKEYVLTARLFATADVSDDPIEISANINYLTTNQPSTETIPESDYIFTGSGNDEINILMNDNDNYVVVDGGADTDTAVINGRSTNYIVGQDDNGNIILTHYQGNIISLIDVETVSFIDKDFAIDELFNARIAIIDGDGFLDPTEMASGITFSGQIFNNAIITHIIVTGLDNNGQTFPLSLPLANLSIDENGLFSIRAPDLIAQGFVDGPLTVQLTTMLNGEVSMAMDTSMVDLTAPLTTPTIASISQDNGLFDSDFITTDNTLSISGTLNKALESDETLQLLIGNSWVNVKASNLSDNLTWSFDDSRFLADGQHTYIARVIDQAGLSGHNDRKEVIIDKNNTDNSGAVITIDRIGADTGESDSDFITYDVTFIIRGSLSTALQSDEIVQVNFDGTTWHLATLQTILANGTTTYNWIYDHVTPLTNNIYDYNVRVISAAGHTISQTNQSIKIDTTISNNQISIEALTNDTGRSDSDFITMNTDRLKISGTLSHALLADESLQIRIDGEWLTIDDGNIIESVTGITWNYQDLRVGLADGQHAFKLRIIDIAGNESISVNQNITIDTNSSPSTASTGTQIINLELIDDSGIPNDFITNDTTLIFKGQLSLPITGTNENLEVFLDGQWQTITTVSIFIDDEFQEANWQLDLSAAQLTEGEHSFNFRVVDLAGNITDEMTQVVNIDLTEPVFSVEIESGDDDAINLFENETPTVTHINLSDPSISIGDTVNILFNAQGIPSQTIIQTVSQEMLIAQQLNVNIPSDFLIAQGVITTTVTINDLAGNNPTIQSDTVVVDLVAPLVAPTIDFKLTSDTTPTITGTAIVNMADGEYLSVSINGQTYHSTDDELILIGTNWSLTVPDSDQLVEQTYTIDVIILDKAGNTIVDTTTNELVINAASPAFMQPSYLANIENQEDIYFIGKTLDSDIIDGLDVSPQFDPSQAEQVMTITEETHVTTEGFSLEQDKVDISDLLNIDSMNDLEKYLSMSAINDETEDLAMQSKHEHNKESKEPIWHHEINLNALQQVDQTSVVNKLFTNLGNEVLISSNNVDNNYHYPSLLDDDNISD